MSASETESVDGLTPNHIHNREHPKRMALPVIWDEVDELIRLHGETESDRFWDAISVRFDKIGRVLRDRLGPRFPDCPHCDGRLGYEGQGSLVCWDCAEPLPDDVRDAYKREHGRLWGARGHGGSGR